MHAAKTMQSSWAASATPAIAHDSENGFSAQKLMIWISESKVLATTMRNCTIPCISSMQRFAITRPMANFAPGVICYHMFSNVMLKNTLPKKLIYFISSH